MTGDLQIAKVLSMKRRCQALSIVMGSIGIDSRSFQTTPKIPPLQLLLRSPRAKAVGA